MDTDTEDVSDHEHGCTVDVVRYNDFAEMDDKEHFIEDSSERACSPPHEVCLEDSEKSEKNEMNDAAIIIDQQNVNRFLAESRGLSDMGAYHAAEELVMRIQKAASGEAANFREKEEEEELAPPLVTDIRRGPSLCRGQQPLVLSSDQMIELAFIKVECMLVLGRHAELPALIESLIRRCPVDQLKGGQLYMWLGDMHSFNGRVADAQKLYGHVVQKIVPLVDDNPLSDDGFDATDGTMTIQQCVDEVPQMHLLVALAKLAAAMLAMDDVKGAERQLELARDVSEELLLYSDASTNPSRSASREGGGLTGSEDYRAREHKSSIPYRGATMRAVADMMAVKAEILVVKGNWGKAKLVQEEVLKIRRTYAGLHHPSTADALCALADSHIRLCNYREVPSLIDEASAIRLKVYATGHPRLADMDYIKGRYLSAVGMYNQAIDTLSRALEGWQTYLCALVVTQGDRNHENNGDEIHEDSLQTHPQIARILHSIGDTRFHLGYMQAAQKDMDACMTMRQKLCRRDRIDTKGSSMLADSYFSMARLYVGLGRFTDALSYSDECVEIWRRLQEKAGIDSMVEVLVAITWRVHVLVCRGTVQDIKEVTSSLGRNICAILGKHHMHVADCLKVLGDYCAFRGKFADADKLYRKALDTSTQLLGEHHPEVACIQHSYAACLRARGDYMAAGDMSTQSINYYVHHFGTDSVWFAFSLHERSQLQRDVGDIDRARNGYVSALKLIKQSIGEDNAHFARVLYNAGECFRLAEEAELARTVLEKALLLREAHYGSDSLAVYEVRVSLLEYALDEFGALEQVEKDVRQLEELWQCIAQLVGPQHPYTMYVRANVGLGKNVMAVTYMEWRMEEKLVELAGRDHECVRCLQQLLSAHANTGDPNEVQKTSARKPLSSGAIKQRKSASGKVPQAALNRNDETNHLKMLIIPDAVLEQIDLPGQREIDQALDYFEMAPQLEFSEFHPWVLRFGGYIAVDDDSNGDVGAGDGRHSHEVSGTECTLDGFMNHSDSTMEEMASGEGACLQSGVHVQSDLLQRLSSTLPALTPRRSLGKSTIRPQRPWGKRAPTGGDDDCEDDDHDINRAAELPEGGDGAEGEASDTHTRVSASSAGSDLLSDIQHRLSGAGSCGDVTIPDHGAQPLDPEEKIVHVAMQLQGSAGIVMQRQSLRVKNEPLYENPVVVVDTNTGRDIKMTLLRRKKRLPGAPGNIHTRTSFVTKMQTVEAARDYIQKSLYAPLQPTSPKKSSKMRSSKSSPRRRVLRGDVGQSKRGQVLDRNGAVVVGLAGLRHKAGIGAGDQNTLSPHLFTSSKTLESPTAFLAEF
jgi:tetratricopeptide (TPR) repeat protein